MKTLILRIALVCAFITVSLSVAALSPIQSYYYKITCTCGEAYYKKGLDYNPTFKWTYRSFAADMANKFGMTESSLETDYEMDLSDDGRFKQYIFNQRDYRFWEAVDFIGDIFSMYSFESSTLQNISWTISGSELDRLCESKSPGTYTISRWIRFKSTTVGPDIFVEFNLDIIVTEAEKAATPTISYDNGTLHYTTSTPDARIYSEVKVADAKQSNTSSVALTQTYNITAYAVSQGYINSDVATATLVFANATLTDTPTSAKAIAVDTLPLLITQDDGMVSISGVSHDDDIAAFTTDGKQIAKCKAIGTSALLNLSSLQGSIAIIKVNNRSAKVMVE